MLVERHLLVYQAEQSDQILDVPATLAQIEAQEGLPLPPTVREVILARLGRLSEAATAILLAGAVLGRAATFEQLGAISALDEGTGLMGLETLLRCKGSCE